MDIHDAKRRRLDPPDVEAFPPQLPRRPQLHPSPSVRSNLHPQLHPTVQVAQPWEEAAGPRYQTLCVLGRGSFGTVCKATEVRSRKTVAIKTVAFNGAGRELEVLRHLNGSPNVVHLLGVFEGSDPEAKTLNFVLEYIEDTLGRIIKHHRQQGTEMDFQFVRIYLYQLLRGLGSLCREGVVHRDIKPANLLVDPTSYTLKVCDFGTAKWVSNNEVSQAYVCSRFYRAPELILSARDHTTAVDMWAAGCVLGEMLLHQPLFAGKDGIDQLFKIMEILGTPTPQQLYSMNPFYDAAAGFTQVPALKWSKVLRARWSAQVEELLSLMLQLDPKLRPHPLEAMGFDFFGELRKNPPKRVAADFFNFTDQERSSCSPEVLRKLLPETRVSTAGF
ncbi:unnamed protein product [Effrenium voratum]|nr:unnamed protein product [Effrenium voratum]|mmetsp:Transcript_66858/g.159546  ORF Transcript_66858/g.159546 Transcript_66858/m.159546 type:complete len:389 (+) Transcript_66858:60-1226(+)